MVSVAVREHPARIGRYRMFGAFARGGMASVHLGRFTGPAGFSRVVALKLLHPGYATEPEYYTMLLDEARISSRIVHPNVVQTLDVVQQGERLCIVMEYVHGASLADAIRLLRTRSERIPPALAASILVGVLRGLHAAHEARSEDGTPLGIVHRDISPQNIVIGVDGVARVLDFGVARALHKVHITREGHVKGKIAYMAPEQLSGGGITRQADIRAAGVVLWETLVGRKLFEDDNDARLMMRVLTEPVPPPSRSAPGVPDTLDAVVARAVAFDRRTRFATADEMAAALEATLTPASTSDVAAWIQRTAEDLLDERAQLVREAERDDGVPESFDAAADDATADGTGTGTAIVAKVDRPNARRMRIGSAIAAILALACAGVAFVRLHSAGSQPSRRAATESAAAASATPAATSPPTGTLGPSTLVLDPVVVPVAAAAATSEPTPSPSAARPRPRGVPRPAVSTHSPSARSACDPPYSIDSDGMKHYKTSCLP
jgi:serine/threonine-protein kinase